MYAWESESTTLQFIRMLFQQNIYVQLTYIVIRTTLFYIKFKIADYNQDESEWIILKYQSNSA